MKAQKDRHLEALGEANRDKHINFLAEENGDIDPADEQFDDTNDDNENENVDTKGPEDVDNGFFTDDNEVQTEKESENDKPNHSSLKNEKVSPAEPDEKPTLADRITVASVNEDILTPVKDDKTIYTNNAHQAG